MKMAGHKRGFPRIVFPDHIFDAPVTICSNSFTIGRSPCCSLSFRDNKLISGQHCKLSLCHPDVILEDCSTNGTIINGVQKLKQGQKASLKDGDVVYLVKKKSDSKDDVSFIFQAASSDATFTVASTVVNETVAHFTETQLPEVKLVERDDSISSTDGDSSSARELGSEKDEISTSPPPFKVPKLVRVAVDLQDKAEVASGGGDKISCDTLPVSEVDRDCGHIPKLRRLADEMEPKSGETVLGSAADTILEVTDVDKDHEQSEIVIKSKLDHLAQKEEDVSKPSTSKKVEKKDGMAETLLCSICCDLIHDCISLQPCMHCFCAGCYSGWMERSSHCPECRLKVDRISKNHMVNNVVETYLQEHPDKRRSADDLKELDDKNTITEDMVPTFCELLV